MDEQPTSYDDAIEETYRVSELENMSLEEIQELFMQALGELKEVRIEYDEF